MKALAIIINIFFPGIGSLVVKKFGAGIAQIILGIIAVALTATGLLSIVGIPLLIGVWIWAIVTAVQSNPEPMQVVVKNN
jgi:TM2 domain-containing membrane protein YozV